MEVGQVQRSTTRQKVDVFSVDGDESRWPITSAARQLRSREASLADLQGRVTRLCCVFIDVYDSTRDSDLDATM